MNMKPNERKEASKTKVATITLDPTDLSTTKNDNAPRRNVAITASNEAA
jgi:hypothetical protein